jgi:RNA polymerase sigma-70 factor (ECF subfamily)
MGVPAQAEQHVLLGEIEAWLNRLVSGRDAENHKTIFWLYYRQGMSASSISQIKAFGLTTKGVESVIYRLTHLLETNLALPRDIGTAGFARSKGTGEA